MVDLSRQVELRVSYERRTPALFQEWTDHARDSGRYGEAIVAVFTALKEISLLPLVPRDQPWITARVLFEAIMGTKDLRRIISEELDSARKIFGGSIDYPGFSNGAQKAISLARDLACQISGNETVDIRHLLAALLKREIIGDPIEALWSDGDPPRIEHAVALLRAEIEGHQEDAPDEWSRLIPFLDWDDYLRHARGARFNFNRVATAAEARIDVETYADVLAQIYRMVEDGEFCVGIYGPWGRGKSFLMSRVAAALPTSYRVVHFSAWRYPGTPEVWVHLYEAFAQAAKAGGLIERTAHTFRAGLARYGWWPLGLAYAGLVTAIVPLSDRIVLAGQAIIWLTGVFGVLGVVFIVLFTLNLRTTGARLKRFYLHSQRHADKLGLQATIGADLVVLLKGWICLDPPSPLAPLVGVVLVLIAGSMFGIRFAGNHAVVSAVIAPCFLVFGVILVLLRERGTRRILLVIDDLDRCRPEQMVHVIESIKLMLEESEVNRRVQVAMLVEEDVLKHALLDRYASLLDPARADALQTRFAAAPRQLVRECMEKLFTMHLRLAPLTHKDVSDIIRTFVRNEHTRASDSPAARLTGASNEVTSPARPVGSNASDFKDVPKLPLAAPSIGHPAVGCIGSVLDNHEAETIFDALAEMPEGSYALGPRAIRSLIFRYELARIMLGKRGVPWEPRELACALVGFDSTSMHRELLAARYGFEFATIIEQVS